MNRPLSRQMPCPVCGPHEQHSPLPCDAEGCACHVVPVPGVQEP